MATEGKIEYVPISENHRGYRIMAIPVADGPDVQNCNCEVVESVGGARVHSFVVQGPFRGRQTAYGTAVAQAKLWIDAILDAGDPAE